MDGIICKSSKQERITSCKGLWHMHRNLLLDCRPPKVEGVVAS